MQQNSNEEYQVTVVNIKYRKVLNGKDKHRPEMAILDVPQGICNLRDTEKFEDSIESFAYNTLTKKYGAEVNFCQVFLPN